MAARKAACRGALLLVLALLSAGAHCHKLSDFRAVLQTEYGDLHLAFYPEVAPKTVELVISLLESGSYNTNHFFRVDKGFVAQAAGVVGGRTAKLDQRQQSLATKTVPLEVRKDVKHDKRGILSLARHADPNSGGSSFSVLLGPAPHLDMNYAVFGEVTEGWEALDAMELLETTRDGIFVMPKKRVTIESTYTYWVGDEPEGQLSHTRVSQQQQRLDAAAVKLQAIRQEELPGS